MKIKIIDKIRTLTGTDIKTLYSEVEETIYIPVYLSTEGKIIAPGNIAHTAEKAWNSINHSLVSNAIVIQIPLKGSDFFD